MPRAQRQRRSDVRGPVSEQEVIEGLRPVCICKGIRARVILQVIRSGRSTVKEVQQATGAGSGSCKGDRCTPRIEELLRREHKRDG